MVEKEPLRPSLKEVWLNIIELAMRRVSNSEKSSLEGLIESTRHVFELLNTDVALYAHAKQWIKNLAQQPKIHRNAEEIEKIVNPHLWKIEDGEQTLKEKYVIFHEMIESIFPTDLGKK